MAIGTGQVAAAQSRPADDGGRREDLSRGLIDRVESCAQDRPNAGRQRLRVRHAPDLGRAGDGQCLHDVQRQPLCGLTDAGAFGRQQVRRAELIDERGDRLLRQALQGEMRGRGGRQRAQGLGRGGRHVLVTPGQDQQDRSIGQPTSEHRHGLERGAIEPVDVVEPQGPRAAAGSRRSR